MVRFLGSCSNQNGLLNHETKTVNPTKYSHYWFFFGLKQRQPYCLEFLRLFYFLNFVSKVIHSITTVQCSRYCNMTNWTSWGFQGLLYSKRNRILPPIDRENNSLTFNPFEDPRLQKINQNISIAEDVIKCIRSRNLYRFIFPLSPLFSSPIKSISRFHFMMTFDFMKKNHVKKHPVLPLQNI